MSHMPKVSIIVPVLNGEKYIGRCIRSLLAQTMKRTDYEIIVVNDGSTDKTKYALEIFGDEVAVLDHVERMGLPSALNTGIRAARGPFIVRVDADDYVHAEYLNFLYSFLSMNSDYDAIACDYFEVDDREEIIERKSCLKEPIGCGIMFRIEQLIDIGLYDEKFLLNEEKELRIRFEKKFSVQRLALPLYRYRQHDKNITRDKKGMEKYIKKITKKHGTKVRARK